MDTTTLGTSSSSSTSVLIAALLISSIALLILIIAQWKVFVKAGKPGWASIVPVYNNWVLFEIVGYQGWWSLLQLIPFVNFFVYILIFISYFKLAKSFGKSDFFAVMNIFFPYICMLILGFGSAKYAGLTENNPMPKSSTAPKDSATTPPTVPTI
jgi:hypothetical protein